MYFIRHFSYNFNTKDVKFMKFEFYMFSYIQRYKNFWHETSIIFSAQMPPLLYRLFKL